MLKATGRTRATLQSRGQVVLLIVGCFVVASGVNAYYFMQLLDLTENTAFGLREAFSVSITYQAHSDFWHVEGALAIVTAALAPLCGYSGLEHEQENDCDRFAAAAICALLSAIFAPTYWLIRRLHRVLLILPEFPMPCLSLLRALSM